MINELLSDCIINGGVVRYFSKNYYLVCLMADSFLSALLQQK